MVVRAAWVPVVVLAGGCYRPSLDSTCFAACQNACPDGFDCQDGRCMPLRAGLCDGSAPDGNAVGGDEDNANVVCHGGSPFKLCLPHGQGALDFSGLQTLDTGACTQVATLESSAFEVCVVSAASIVVTGTLKADGPRPLVLWADAITIDPMGTVDVSSTLNVFRGAGANDPACTVPVALNGLSLEGGGGGPGGSFATHGGAGGIPGQPATLPVAAAPPVPDLTAPRGGCPGSTGGGSGNTPGGAAGPSGGAVYLYADQQLVIDGNIDASGAAANIPAPRTGGGGGGSGGVIVIASATLLGVGHVLAAGGGGAGAGGTGDSGGGQPESGGAGGAANVVGMTSPSDVLGGNRGTNGEGGFGGGTDAFLSGGGAHDGGNGIGLTAIGFSGGGGGGGGAGFIKVYEGTLPGSVVTFPVPAN